MTAFLWTVGVLTAIDTLGRLIWLYKGQPPERTNAEVFLDVIAGVALMIWAAVLITRG